MDERKITMMAIRHLGQMGEAINSLIERGELPFNRITTAAQRSQDCGARLSRIAGDDLVELPTAERMEGIADSMKWLAGVRKQFDPDLTAWGRFAPDLAAVNDTSAKAMALARPAPEKTTDATFRPDQSVTAPSQVKLMAAVKVAAKALERVPERMRAEVLGRIQNAAQNGNLKLPEPKIAERTAERPRQAPTLSMSRSR